MPAIKTFFNLVKNNRKDIPNALLRRFARSPISRPVSDKIYLKLSYRVIFHKKLDFDNPKTFNEKLQWIKLYDRNPEYTAMVDKYQVREYIEKKLGDKYLIPLLGVWDDPKKIDFNSLPEKFVLKCTHDSGSVILCDKKSLDETLVRKKLASKLKKNMFWWGREWPYKNVKPQIIAERFMQDSSGELRDYKFMCFNGKVKCSFVCSDRFSDQGLHVTFFDKEWNVMPFERSFPSVKEGLPKPANYDKMLELAETLSEGIPFVRVDFYEVNDQIYFGELTFFPGNGMEAFQPEEWDYQLGEWITLPERKKKRER